MLKYSPKRIDPKMPLLTYYDLNKAKAKDFQLVLKIKD